MSAFWGFVHGWLGLFGVAMLIVATILDGVKWIKNNWLYKHREAISMYVGLLGLVAIVVMAIWDLVAWIAPLIN